MRSLLAFLAGALLFSTPFAARSEEEPPPRRIVAVGDLHGDFDVWLAIARAAGLADDEGRWTGDQTVLVQLGDLTDRGPDSLKIIRHLQALETAAAKAGGKVVVLLGNHEAMNVIGDLRYVHPGEYEAFADRSSKRRRELTWRANREQILAGYRTLDPEIGEDEAKARWFEQTPLGKLEHRRAWWPGGELGQWAAGLPVVVKIGSTLFVHGGLSAERGLEEIETINAGHSAALKPGADVDRSLIEDPLGPLWYRGNIIRGASESGRPTIEEELAMVLERHGASRLVVGHTPSLKGIVTSDDGRFIRIDTGASRFYGGLPSYLEITAERLVAHQRDAEGAWNSRELAQTAEEGSP